MTFPCLETDCALEELESANSRTSSTEFVAVGKSENPRWLLPVGHKLSGQEFLGWKPYRVSSQLAWAGLKTLVRWGGTGGLTSLGCERVEWAAERDWRSLGWSKSTAPIPLIYLGTPGERRKAVFHLIDSKSGLCELIVKIPLTDGASRAIAHEAAMLRRLEADEFVGAPRLVQYDEARAVSSQTVVPGVRCGMHFTRELGTLLESLRLHGETITLAEVTDRLSLATQGLESDSCDISLFESAISEIQCETALPAYRIHGDFAPWNIHVGAGGPAALVDWEDAQTRGLPLHDAFHFAHMTRFLFGHNPQPAYTNMRFRPFPELSLGLCRKLEIAFLLQRLLQQLSRRNSTQVAYLRAVLRLVMAAHP